MDPSHLELVVGLCRGALRLPELLRQNLRDSGGLIDMGHKDSPVDG
jgi:hypothetical protein